MMSLSSNIAPYVPCSDLHGVSSIPTCHFDATLILGTSPTAENTTSSKVPQTRSATTVALSTNKSDA